MENITLEKLETFRGKRFKSMAEGRNAIEKTTQYTSNMRDNDKTYIGRGSKAGFICENGLYNQFIDLSKEDGKWNNTLVDDLFIESWKDSSREDEILEWQNGKKDLTIRLFVKGVGSKVYEGYGIYSYSGKSQNGVLWKRS